MTTVPCCPSCGCDLDFHGTLTLAGWASSPTPQAPTADLILECDECEAKFNAFVSLSDFLKMEP